MERDEGRSGNLSLTTCVSLLNVPVPWSLSCWACWASVCCYIWVFSLTLGSIWTCWEPGYSVDPGSNSSTSRHFALVGVIQKICDVLLPDVLGLSSSACSLTEKSDTVHWVCDLTLHFKHQAPVTSFQIQNFLFFFNIVIFYFKASLNLPKIST